MLVCYISRFIQSGHPSIRPTGDAQSFITLACKSQSFLAPEEMCCTSTTKWVPLQAIMNVFFSAVIFVSLHQKVNLQIGSTASEREKKENFHIKLQTLWFEFLTPACLPSSERFRSGQCYFHERVISNGFSKHRNKEIFNSREVVLEKFTNGKVKWKNRKRLKSGLWFRVDVT